MINKNITTKEIKIPAYDGDAFKAYVAMPDDASNSNQYPVIIVIQEIFGINQVMRDICDQYAAKGYVTICPDLFWRIKPGIELDDNKEEKLQRAFELFIQFSTELGLEDLKTTLGYSRNMPVSNKKIGALGFCLGGKLSYMISAHSDINASVSYYGVNIQTMLGLSKKINTPLLMHIAGEDEFTDKEAQNEIIEGLSGNENITTYRYEGVDHAFARNNGKHYDKEAAELANKRTDEFLKEHLHD